jgi:glutaminyl-peptide cyclotransferase
MSRFSLLLMLAVVAAGCSQDQPRANSSAHSTTARNTMPAIPEFSGSRAFDLLLKQTSLGPRNPESAGHRNCLQFLLSSLQSTAEEVRTQEFIHTGYGGEKLHLTNIIASFRPAAVSRILLCAHWDTRPRAERDEDKTKQHLPILGANDGASGVAVLLEIAAVLKATPPPVGVDIVLFDGEDYGKEGDIDRYLLGSRHFARNRPTSYAPAYGILLDMVGDANLEIPKEQHSLRSAPDVMNTVWRTARELGITQFSDEIGDEILDDHVPLNEVGIKTVDLIDFAYPDASHRYWHTHNDTPEHCSAESLGAVGTVLTHVIYRSTP